jgi:glycosyltransferase involved in cell wall biosynthesis
VRAIAVPYGKRHFYAESFAASGVVAHSMAYRTPVVCTDWGSLAELDEQVGAAVVSTKGLEGDAVADALARTIASVVDDEQRLTELGRYADKTRQARSTSSTAEAFAAQWSTLLALETKGS